jgi:hypothetical protein
MQIKKGYRMQQSTSKTPKALKSLRPLTENLTLSLFGCGGKTEERKRYQAEAGYPVV